MSFSYDPNQPRDIDKVRFLLKDTNPDDYLLEDEEIAWLLGEYGSVNNAAAEAAAVAAIKFSDETGWRSGDFEIKESTRREAYRQRRDELLSGTGSGSRPIPYSGGISRADKEQKLDVTSDRSQPSFFRGLHSDPRTRDGREWNRRLG